MIALAPLFPVFPIPYIVVNGHEKTGRRIGAQAQQSKARKIADEDRAGPRGSRGGRFIGCPWVKIGYGHTLVVDCFHGPLMR